MSGAGAYGGVRSGRSRDVAGAARIARVASGSSTVAIRRRRPPHCGQASTSISKDHLSYCTSCKGVVLGTRRGAFARRPAVGWTLLLGSVQPLAHLVADPSVEAPRSTPAPEGCPADAELGGDLLAGQHASGDQTLLEARESNR